MMGAIVDAIGIIDVTMVPTSSTLVGNSADS
jgi:hypothetical protein